MIVVDTNVIAYLHISGKFTPSALLLLERDPYWIAPPLWQSEFRNVLVNYVRHNVMTLEVSTELMNQALSTMRIEKLLLQMNWFYHWQYTALVYPMIVNSSPWRRKQAHS